MSSTRLLFPVKDLLSYLVLTLAAARPILWPYASNVPFTTASDADIAAFDAVLNRLCERLIIEGKWRGTFRRVTLLTHGNLLTLPRNLQTCLGCDPVTSSSNRCGFPLNIYSRWYEFAANGLGLSSDSVNSCLIRGLIPVQDDAQTFADPTGTFYLRAVSTSPSGSGFTFLGGKDENGTQLYGHVRLAVADGTTTTTQKYTEMPFIEKAVTQAGVSLIAVDTTTAVETLLCVYAPSETIPSYRRYVIPNAADGDSFSCLCDLKFVPAIVDTDIVIPSVTDALILGLMSFQFRDKNDAERSALYMGPNNPEQTGKMSGCIDVLDSDRQYLDSSERPVFNVSMQYGAGNIRSVR